MSDPADNYEPDSVESKWREEWQEMDVYEYSDTSATDYVIDTPPPYPTGNLHIGHALGWAYIDFAARYHRLQGEDVLFPQGGTVTACRPRSRSRRTTTSTGRTSPRRVPGLCVEHTEDQIDSMKETMLDLGFGIDWSAEYRTMDEEYWGRPSARSWRWPTQTWCTATNTPSTGVRGVRRPSPTPRSRPRRASTGRSTTSPSRRGQRRHRNRDHPTGAAGGPVSMAVDPGDERYADRVGDTFEVPLFGQEVELIADDDVDGDFGTGAVMICTFGDKQDVDWWAEHDLDLRPVFTEDGHLDELAGEFEGLSIAEAKTEVAEALDDEGYLNDSEPTTQNVGQCWRCDTPIEILSKEQWFVEVDQDLILEKAQEVEWIPEHMYARLEEWTEGMDWDWVISPARLRDAHPGLAL